MSDDTPTWAPPSTDTVAHPVAPLPPARRRRYNPLWILRPTSPVRIHPAHLIPAAVVVILAIVGPLLPDTHHCGASTDAPQFACWLKENP